MTKTAPKDPITLQDQGSFAAGGVVLQTPGDVSANDPKRPADGQTFHGDHAYVTYQIPVNARKLPLVMWHGVGQFSKTWSTTPDGRDGYQNIFLRRGFGVYLVDQPRRGNAGRSTMSAQITPVHDEQSLFGSFRLGIWPDFFPGVQFSQDPAALNQYFRQMTPSIGPIDTEVNASAISALFDQIGPGVLVTHSHSGGMGWLTAVKNDNVKGIVCYEPGTGFIFPEGEVPDPISNYSMTISGVAAPMDDFLKLARIPIIVIYGDYIPTEPTPTWGDNWRIRKEMALRWRDVVNRYGGDVTVCCLPDIGINGNTHFPFSDLNNIEVADHMSAFLTEKKLDQY